METLYAVLGVDPTASATELRSAFKLQALLHHPDKGGTKDAFHRVMFAYESLADAAGRARYDQELAVQFLNAKRNEESSRRSEKRAPKQFNMRSDVAGHAGESTVPCMESKRQRAAASYVSSGSFAKPSQHDSSRPDDGGSTADHMADEDGTKTDTLLTQDFKKLFALLKQMQPETRRKVILIDFSQVERLAFEAWVTKESSRSTNEDPTVVVSPEHVSYGSDAEGSSSSSMDSCCPGSGALPTLEVADVHQEFASSSVDEVPMLMDLDDSPRSEPYLFAEGPSAGASGISPSKVRGIKTEARKDTTYYRAYSWVRFIVLESCWVQDLSQAIDNLAVLTDVAQRTRTNIEVTLGDRLAAALPCVFADHGVSYESVGLSIHLEIRYKYWVGKTKLRTPKFHIIDDALAAVRLLCPHFREACIKDQTLLARNGISGLRSQWDVFKLYYLDVCAGAGWCRERVASRVKRYEAAAEAARERTWEQWNRSAMIREDRLSLRHRRIEQEIETVDDRLLRYALAVLRRWRRREVSKARKSAKAKKDAAVARAQEAREVVRARNAERDARWKWMNRKDITMAEILERRGGSPNSW